MPMGKTLAAATGAFLLLAGFAATEASAQQAGKAAGDFMIRGRLIGVVPDEDSTITPIRGEADLSNEWVPEVDFSYFVTDNIAFELIAATTKHNVKANGTTLGNVDLGSVGLLPPTLTAQYHFMPKSAFSPYVGAGLTYAVFYNEDRPSSVVNSIHYDNAWGYALQAGFDYNISGNWYFNADVKKIFLNTDVTINSTIKADVDIDPWVVGVGIGYKF
jgi:outer membrane protein